MKHHPNVYEFLHALITEQGVTETLIAQMNAGQVVTNPNKTYVQINRRIASLQEQFDAGDIGPLAYIRSVAHNLAEPVAF